VRFSGLWTAVCSCLEGDSRRREERDHDEGEQSISSHFKAPEAAQLLWDRQRQPKPTFTAVVEALRAAK
jgi:hypothetical protein